MKTSFRNFSVAAVFFALAPMAANADPVLGPNGHYYEVIPAAAIAWDDANALAGSEELKNQWGIAGHLATLTSQEERDFVEALRQASGLGQVWIGGFQLDNQATPAEGWYWVEEDEINPATLITDFNWNAAEPNDGGGGENNQENHLAIGRYGNDGTWNDEGVALGLIQGFVVEYSGTVAASRCIDGSGTVCNPSGAQSVTLPAEIAGNLPGDATITQLLVKPPASLACDGSEYGFLDPRVYPNGRVMDAVELDVFGDGSLILPAHQFGSPCFAVVKGGTNFDLTPALSNGGVVDMSQIPEDVPGIGQTFDCLSAANPDLQTTTQFGYQTDNRFDMVEEAGAAMTNGCNSPSRAGTFKMSYFVLNTHEDCGIMDYNAPGGRAAIQQCFTDFAVNKFDAFETVLYIAKPNMTSGKFSDLSKELNKARSMTKTGKYAKSNQRLEVLRQKIEAATWDVSNGDNEPGNLIMRVNNLIFRNEQLEKAASY